MSFFDDNILLAGKASKSIYNAIKDLPIIDYHCHLDERAIYNDAGFDDIGELWLKADHYKWRAMRLCGVDEHFITGGASWEEKFFAYAKIMPMLIGNPLYYWTHLELKMVFGIEEPLNEKSAKCIREKANEQLKSLSVGKLLEKFKVEFIATTDDPESTLEFHGKMGNTIVSPTFRPDRCFKENVDKGYLEKRLDYFVAKGCRIVDHGFDDFDRNRDDILWLMRVCKERDLILQLHFGTYRNINSRAFNSIGRDSGYDVFRSSVNTDALAEILDIADRKGELPKIILYTLNDNYIKALGAISGAFKGVYLGAAWWFNDTVSGIKRQLDTTAEYAALGTNFGMLTDSRSFSSYVRFDFFRRILADYIGDMVERGEYDPQSAEALAKNICYYNIKEALKL